MCKVIWSACLILLLSGCIDESSQRQVINERPVLTVVEAPKPVPVEVKAKPTSEPVTIPADAVEVLPVSPAPLVDTSTPSRDLTPVQVITAEVPYEAVVEPVVEPVAVEPRLPEAPVITIPVVDIPSCTPSLLPSTVVPLESVVEDGIPDVPLEVVIEVGTLDSTFIGRIVYEDGTPYASGQVKLEGENWVSYTSTNSDGAFEARARGDSRFMLAVLSPWDSGVRYLYYASSIIVERYEVSEGITCSDGLAIIECKEDEGNYLR